MRRPTQQLVLMLALLSAGCPVVPAPAAVAPNRKEELERRRGDALFFASPREAIPIITALLRKNDWITLSRYYDLSSSQVKRSELESGAFFMRKERPPAAHPGGFWRYKHPFSPGFEYKGHTRPREGVVAVEVGIEIDQGGGMVQRGRATFKMRKGDAGWRVLPQRAVPPSDI